VRSAETSTSFFKMVMYEVSTGQYDLVYNALSFTLASMMASTIFFWLRLSSVHEKYKSAMCITGLVTFIAAYHYFRIFNSWVGAYEFAVPSEKDASGAFIIADPSVTGVAFNDAYRYMDWLLTVPMLLVEIVLVMKLSPEETFNKGLKLGVAAALMIVAGYPGELILDSADLSSRWLYWAVAMVPFMYIVYTLMFGLSAALEAEDDNRVRDLIWFAQRMTIVSWLTYPVVYIIPMFGVSGAGAVIAIQIGYCISDIISKCGVGLVIYKISMAKTYAMAGSVGKPLTSAGYGSVA